MARKKIYVVTHETERIKTLRKSLNENLDIYALSSDAALNISRELDKEILLQQRRLLQNIF